MESVPLTSFCLLLLLLGSVGKRSQKNKGGGSVIGLPTHPPQRSLPRRPTAEGRTLTLTLTVILFFFFEIQKSLCKNWQLWTAPKEMDMETVARVVLLLSAQPLVCWAVVSLYSFQLRVRKQKSQVGLTKPPKKKIEVGESLSPQQQQLCSIIIIIQVALARSIHPLSFPCFESAGA